MSDVDSAVVGALYEFCSQIEANPAEGEGPFLNILTAAKKAGVKAKTLTAMLVPRLW
jgi:hypothetical protein